MFSAFRMVMDTHSSLLTICNVHYTMYFVGSTPSSGWMKALNKRLILIRALDKRTR